MNTPLPVVIIGILLIQAAAGGLLALLRPLIEIWLQT